MKSAVRGLLCFWILFFSISGSLFSQVSAYANASATVVNPIGLTKESDLDFGNVSAGPGAGTVVLQPDGQRVQNGGATLPASPGNVAPGVFNVTGAPFYTYSITLPTTPSTLANGTHVMTMDSFTSEPSGSGLLDPNGHQEIRIGARLNVGAAQQTGVYQTLTPFMVTVNYN